MKGLCSILLVVVLYCSCNKEDDSVDTNTYGTLLQSIETYLEGDENPKLRTFFYDSNDNLTSYIINRPESDWNYQFDYLNGRLEAVRTLIGEVNYYKSKDSIIYNSVDKIGKTYSIQQLHQQLTNEIEYIYDNTDLLIGIKRTDYHTGENIAIDSIYWSDGNIVRINEYDANGQFYQSYEYEYDDKFSHETNCGAFYLPTKCKNNVTKYTVKDENGLVPFECNPCSYEYKYNLDNFPVERTSESNNRTVYTYQ